MPFPDKKITIFLTIFISVAMSIFLAGSFLYASKNKKNTPLNLTASTLYPSPKQLGNFSLLYTDEDTIEEFNTHNLQGQWHLFFMGYTSCPHICPTEMQNLSQLYKQLPAEIQKNTQVMMVTTDPLKDTPEKLQEFVKKFHPDFIGLSGTKDQIAVFAKQFSMPFFPSDETDKTKQYEVNHSASIYLTNPQGKLHAVFSTPHDISDMHVDMLQIVTAF